MPFLYVDEKLFFIVNLRFLTSLSSKRGISSLGLMFFPPYLRLLKLFGFEMRNKRICYSSDVR